MQVQRIAKLTGHQASIFTVVPSADARKVLTGAGEGWVVEWDLTKTDTATVRAKVETNIYALAYLESKNWIVAGNMYGGVHWVDLNQKKDLRNIAQHEKGVFDIQVFENQVFTVGGDGTITRWDIDTQRPLESLNLSNQSLRAMAFSAKRQEIAIGASDNNIYLLNLDFTVKKIIKNAHENSVFTLKYSPDERYLLSGSRDAHLTLWDIEADFLRIKNLPAHLFTINHITFHPSKPFFATASRDKTIKIWDYENFKLVKVIDVVKFGGHINSVNKLYWSTFNHWLISVSDDRTVMIWEIEM